MTRLAEPLFVINLLALGSLGVLLLWAIIATVGTRSRSPLFCTEADLAETRAALEDLKKLVEELRRQVGLR